jgi:hypothetical protein
MLGPLQSGVARNDFLEIGIPESVSGNYLRSEWIRLLPMGNSLRLSGTIPTLGNLLRERPFDFLDFFLRQRKLRVFQDGGKQPEVLIGYQVFRRHGNGQPISGHNRA